MATQKKIDKKLYHMLYYQDNKDKITERIRSNSKNNNYKNEKTPEQRKIRNVKRQTRYYHPLTNKKCQLCGQPATEHHHTTEPISVNDYIFVCHHCHLIVHRLIKLQEIIYGKHANHRNCRSSQKRR